MSTTIIHTPNISLTCCCCDCTTVGRQWWNRDTGYGLCSGCAEHLLPDTPDGALTREYGVRGYHFDPKPSSEARRVGADLATGARPWSATLYAPDSVVGAGYAVGYFQDGSILIHSQNAGYAILDEPGVTYRRTLVEHLARCLGLFDRETIAKIVGESDRWIDGIHWGADGRFIEL